MHARRHLGRDDLIASYYTLSGADISAPARHPFAARVAPARAAGFAGIGLFCEDYFATVAGGLSPADMRATLADHGIVLAELEFLFDWWRDGERGAASRRLEERLYEVADALGPR